MTRLQKESSKMGRFFLLASLGALLAVVSGYGSAKEGRCPHVGRRNCEDIDPSQLYGCIMDTECNGTKKCCSDGCGGYTCKPAILRKRPGHKPCPEDKSVVKTNDQRSDCKDKRTKFCYKNNCRRCCFFQSTCNPNPYVLKSVGACEKVLCSRKKCPLQGQICKMDKRFNRVKCVCPLSCPLPSRDDSVCGTDGITYPSRCEMNLTACVIGDRIAVVYNGTCRIGRRVTVSMSHQTEQVVIAGKKGKVICQFDGDPVQIIWDKVGLERLPPRRMVPNRETLVIKTVRVEDIGMYVCSAYDGSVVVTSAVNVTVKVPKPVKSKTIKPRSVCLQPSLIGTGFKFLVRYFYNSAKRVCEPFVYSGIGGNKNNFADKESCSRSCMHSATEICSLPKLTGPCMARFIRWYYCTRTSKCKMFTYGGCHGNANNFESKAACAKKCSAKHICSLPIAAGSCDGHVARYFHNTTSNKCKKFFYTGCEGNANRFPTMLKCKRKCTPGVNGYEGKSNKRGTCPPANVDLRSCSDSISSTCTHDSDCRGRSKCCFDGCQMTCKIPMKKHLKKHKVKLGQCPTPMFSGKVCSGRHMVDMCTNDPDCPGHRKCCNNGCNNECLIPKKLPIGRPKPGICPIQDFIDPELCENTRDECTTDSDCFGRSKCCFSGCLMECMLTPGSKPKPGQCPVEEYSDPELCKDQRDDCQIDDQCPGNDKCCFTGCKMECLTPPGKETRPGKCPKPWKGQHGPCDLLNNMCQRDSECPNDWKCCFNGCQKDCIKPTDGKVIDKPGKCPAPWKGQNGICDRMGDRCQSDVECGGNEKCCFNGCQKDCVPAHGDGGKGKPDKSAVGQCPKPWKDSKYCDRMGDLCDSDVDCFGNFKCCYTGCQKDCVKAVNLTTCQLEKQKAQNRLSGEVPPLGLFVPRCSPDGSYEPVQCHGSVGHCWCVDEHGLEINGTRLRGQPNCTASVGPAKNKTLCEKKLEVARAPNGLPPIGRFVPRCKADGSFKLRQCSGSIGFCWCVNPTNGEEVTGTRQRGNPDCTDAGLSKCQRHYRDNLINPPIGRFLPSCNDGGNYAEMQCWGSTGYCWCVDQDGTELLGSKIRGRPNCTALLSAPRKGLCPTPWKGHSGACDYRGDMCDKDTDCLMPQKCCFNGCQRDCVKPGANKTICQSQHEVAMGLNGIPPPGRFVPRCNADGSFELQQCSGSIGFCWCVNPTNGEEVTGTRQRGNPDCTDAGLSKCQQHYRDNLIHPPFGRFLPLCKDDGSYDETQCHGSTGYCWCVDHEGSELMGTRVRGSPNCNTSDPCGDVKCDFYGQCTVNEDGNTTCKCPIGCTLEYMPVCGTDGRTYGNACEMRVRACLQKTMITVASPGECPDSCSSMNCGFYSQCKVVNGSAQCVCPMVCPQHYMPVCGSDGKMYSNECQMRTAACKQQKMITPSIPSKCKPEDPCANTVCSHPLQRCVVVKHKPRCECPKFKCSRDPPVVCGTDGKTYLNRCIMDNKACIKDLNVTVWSQGPCPALLSADIPRNPCENSPCSHPQHTCQNINNAAVCKCRNVMTLNYAPVCASDGKTYANVMSMKNAGCYKNMVLKVVSRGQCPKHRDPCEISLCDKGQACVMVNGSATCQCLQICPANYDPVCASNGKTYSNRCAMDAEACTKNIKLTVASKGPCAKSGKCPSPWKGLSGVCDRRGSMCDKDDQCPGQHKCCFNGCQKDCVLASDGLKCPKACGARAHCVAFMNGERRCVCKPGSVRIGRECKENPCNLVDCSPYARCHVVRGVAVCRCPKVCHHSLSPVCGSDGKVYATDCELRRVSCEAKKLIHIADRDSCEIKDPCKDSSCSHPLQECRKLNDSASCVCLPRPCTQEYAPVCASDGKTYANRCTMDSAGCAKSMNLKPVRNGTCPQTKPKDPCAGIKCSHPLQMCVRVAKGRKPSCECPYFKCSANSPAVCGSDGKTYPNDCNMKSSNCRMGKNIKILQRGACPANLSVPLDPCENSPCSHPQHICNNVNNTAVCKCRNVMTLEYAPVCASDSKTYPNVMSMENAGCRKSMILKVVSQGQCIPDPCSLSPCSHPLQRCKMVKNSATCVCPLAVPAIWRPVCGSDGKTYSSRRAMEIQGCRRNMVLKVFHQGECRRLLDPCDISLCSHHKHRCVMRNGQPKCVCIEACTLQYDPVCGSDGKVYPNLCNLEVASCKANKEIAVIKKGSCDLSCPKQCDVNAHCVEFLAGGRKCVCNDGFIGNGTTCAADLTSEDPCDIALCSYPYSICVPVNGTATCECPAVCTRDLMPVCGSDNKTYDNMCLLEIEACKPDDTDWLTLLHEGPCPPAVNETAGSPCEISLCSFPHTVCVEVNGTASCECPKACTRELYEVCGTDGKTYPNPCTLEKEACMPKNLDTLYLAHDGPCPPGHGDVAPGDPCALTLCLFPQINCEVVNGTATCQCPKACTKGFQPVCGTDGKTYPTLCVLATKACKVGIDSLQHAHDGPCPTVDRNAKPCDIALCSFPRTRCVEINQTAHTCECPDICTRELYEVCGTDGKTYGNPCTLEAEACKPENLGKLLLAHDGPCTPINDTAVPSPCELSLCSFPHSRCLEVNGTATCDCPQVCTMEYDPVCGSDNKTYGNLCALEVKACQPENLNKLTLFHFGACSALPPANVSCDDMECNFPRSACEMKDGAPSCECPKACTRELEPVCGTDRHTYSNMCELEIEACKPENDGTLFFAYNGSCQATQGKCPEYYNSSLCPPDSGGPQCVDNTDCPDDMLCCYDGCYHFCTIPEQPPARDPFFRVRNPSPCDSTVCQFPKTQCVNDNGLAKCQCPSVCTAIWAPVCGSDGRTYASACVMAAKNCARPEVTYKLGACTVRDVCGLSPEVGPCEALMPSFFFNSSSANCEPFNYGGCLGNANRFSTHKACVDKCGGLDQCAFKVCTAPYQECNVVGDVATCSCPLACTRELKPVCGSDGKTYDNSCLLKSAACTSRQLIYIKHEGVCKAPPGKCPPVDPRPCRGPSRPGSRHSNGMPGSRGSCRSNDGCSAPMICCFDGCKKQCMMPHLIPNNPSVCPPVELCPGPVHSDYCQTNSDCAGDGKCCLTGCGKDCISGSGLVTPGRPPGGRPVGPPSVRPGVQPPGQRPRP